METPSFDQLYPVAREITAAEFIGALDLTHSDPSQRRPYTIVNFVSSADGRTAVNGQSRLLSDSGDRELHRTLRERVDAVIAGTGTVAAEDYGRMLPGAERRERRLAAGRSAEPLAVLVSRSGRLPTEVRLFAEAQARVLVFSPSAPRTEFAAEVRHEPLDAEQRSPLRGVMSALKQRHGVDTLLCEGGPTFFAALLRERLVDEFFLTLAPSLCGDAGPAVLSGAPLPAPARLTLAGLMRREGSLFLRYRLS